jgi:pimeloyl-ACP methyl ester carboxylesterase
LQQHRNIKVGGATLECTLYGSGIPVVLLANAGCSVGYFDHLARALATGGLQTISVNMRGVGGSLGSLDGTTLHDLAGDVAGVIEAIGCGPAHLVGHAFGNRIARCLAVDQPSLVRSVTLLAAGGLIGPATPVGIGAGFRNAKQSKMNGSDCVTVLGIRWLSPASDLKILEQVECWPAIFLAHLATSRNVPLEQWWGGGAAPLLAIQGSKMKWLPRAMATRSAINSASASGLSICLVRGTFCRWSSPKPLPAPSPSLLALRSLALTGCGRSRGAEMSRYTRTPRCCD